MGQQVYFAAEGNAPTVIVSQISFLDSIIYPFPGNTKSYVLGILQAKA